MLTILFELTIMQFKYDIDQQNKQIAFKLNAHFVIVR